MNLNYWQMAVRILYTTKSLKSRKCPWSKSNWACTGTQWCHVLRMLKQLRSCWFQLSDMCDVLVQIQKERKSFAPVNPCLLTGFGGAVSGASMTWMIPFTAGMSQTNSSCLFTILKLWAENKYRTWNKKIFFKCIFCVGEWLSLTSFLPWVTVRLYPSLDMMTSWCPRSLNGRLLWFAEMWYSRSRPDRV